MTPWTLLHGDALTVLATLPSASVQMVCTSPPYYQLRNYDSPGQIGLEPTVTAYIDRLVAVFGEVKRVLRADGTLWLNLGDSYAVAGNGGGNKQDTNAGSLTRSRRHPPAGLKVKDLIGVPWRVAFALQEDGWTLRSEIIWAKPNPMPESVQDRVTRSHEYVFLLSKKPTYYYNADAIAEPGSEPDRQRMDRIGGANGHAVRHSFGGMIGASVTRNKRSVWTIPTQPTPLFHFATMPEKLVEPCILAGSRPGDTVLDPFVGSGTTCLVAARFNRLSIGIDLNESYLALAERRLLGQPMAMPLGLPVEVGKAAKLGLDVARMALGERV